MAKEKDPSRTRAQQALDEPSPEDRPWLGKLPDDCKEMLDYLRDQWFLVLKLGNNRMLKNCYTPSVTCL